MFIPSISRYASSRRVDVYISDERKFSVLREVNSEFSSLRAAA